jgi:hypothetical protein
MAQRRTLHGSATRTTLDTLKKKKRHEKMTDEEFLKLFKAAGVQLANRKVYCTTDELTNVLNHLILIFSNTSLNWSMVVKTADDKLPNFLESKVIVSEKIAGMFTKAADYYLKNKFSISHLNPKTVFGAMKTVVRALTSQTERLVIDGWTKAVYSQTDDIF